MEGGYPALQFWFSFVHAFLTVMLFVYTRRVTKQKVAEERFQKIEDALLNKADAGDCKKRNARIIAVETKVSEIKVELIHLPSQGQFTELNRGIQSLNGELRNTQGRLEGINRAVDLMNEFLINK